MALTHKPDGFEVSHSMVTGSKYVPPHLRNRGSGGNNNNSGGGGGYGGGDSRRARSSAPRYDDQRRGSYNDRGYGGGGGYGDRRNSDSNAPPATNSRWNNDGPSHGGGGGRYGGGGGGSYGRGGQARRNERGFHGDMTPDKRLEARLFDNSEHQTTGINFDNYDKIPIEVTGENAPDPIDIYSAETIGDDLFRNTQLCGYTRPTPVQKYSVPIGIAGRDLMACAQTGSGKTAGFLFPVLMSMIQKGGQETPENARRRTYPEALILAPTRELAQQIYDEAQRFSYATGIAPVVIYGGADVRDQLRQIDRGCDLLVATPGRLVDMIERGRIAMENVRFLVLDEADRMLDMGFEVSYKCWHQKRKETHWSLAPNSSHCRGIVYAPAS